MTPDDTTVRTAPAGKDRQQTQLFCPDSDWGTTDPLRAEEFAPEVERHHLRFDATACENIYVVGDVHGCLSELQTLWGRLDVGEDDMVVFVGDLIRKGPATDEVVEFVASRENAVSVRGNNEAKVIHDRIDTDPFGTVAETLESFPLVVSWDDSLAVHGGLHPDWSFADHARDDLLEMRAVPRGNSYDGPFWFDQYEGPGTVFFGHTVLEEPVVRESAIGLDTGCVYGGSLTAYDYRRDEFVSVSAERTYRERADAKIL